MAGAARPVPASSWDVLVNATPLGSGVLPGETPVPAESLRPGAVVFDMVYEPRETPLLAGHSTNTGIGASNQLRTWALQDRRRWGK